MFFFILVLSDWFFCCWSASFRELICLPLAHHSCRKYLNWSDLIVVLCICSIFILAFFCHWPNVRESLESKSLVDATSCILSFGLQALILHCGLWACQLSSCSKDLPVSTDLSHLFASPAVSSYSLLYVHPDFLLEGSNRGVLRALPVLLTTLLCSAFSQVLWQTKRLKYPTVEWDILWILHSLRLLGRGRFPKGFCFASYVIFFFPTVSIRWADRGWLSAHKNAAWWAECTLFDFQLVFLPSPLWHSHLALCQAKNSLHLRWK